MATLTAREMPAEYWLLTLSVMLAFLHQGVFSVVLPAGVTEMTGSEFPAGVTLALFSIVSFTIRPVIGGRVDRLGSLPILVTGIAILAVCGYLLAVPVLATIMLANALRGVGWAAVNTGGNVMVAQFATAENRGKLSGYFTIAQSLATSLAPALALPLMRWWGYSPVAALAATLAVASVIAAAGVHRLHWGTWRGIAPLAVFHRTPSPTGARRSIERRALLPAGLLACLTLSQPGMTSFVPLYAQNFELQAWAASLYFVVYGVTSVVIRGLLSSYSDRFGRLQTAAVGHACLLLGLVGMVLRPSELTLLLAGVVYSFGQSLLVPALMALVMDRVAPARMGAGMATHTAAFQVGAAPGAFILGWALTHWSYQASYALLTVGPLIGIAASVVSIRRTAADRDA